MKQDVRLLMEVAHAAASAGSRAESTWVRKTLLGLSFKLRQTSKFVEKNNAPV